MNTAITHIVEYRPYSMRNECCAIGLLSLLPGGPVKVHLSSNLRKVRALHPSVQLEELRDNLEQFARELEQDTSLISLYINGGVGPIKLGEKPGAIRYRTQEEYDAGVRWALSYAADPATSKSQRERQPVSRLFMEMKSYFSNMGWLAGMGHGIRDHRILARYQLSSEEGVGVDFALLNSAMHYVQTADMRSVSNPTHKRHEVQSKWFALGLADALTPADLSGTGVKRYAVVAGSDTEEGKKAIKAAHRVSNAGVFVHESNSDMDELMGIFAQAMRQEPLASPKS